jgi:hypothetical protein
VPGSCISEDGSRVLSRSMVVGCVIVI